MSAFRLILECDAKIASEKDVVSEFLKLILMLDRVVVVDARCATSCLRNRLIIFLCRVGGGGGSST